jgi:predicted dehydrogenase
MEGSGSFVQLSPSFGYSGLKLTYNKLIEGHGTDVQPTIGEKDQFALELDHMATCVKRNQQPHTPGEEGLQDQRIIEAIYESVHSGRPVKLSLPSSPTRGPEPEES